MIDHCEYLEVSRGISITRRLVGQLRPVFPEVLDRAVISPKISSERFL